MKIILLEDVKGTGKAGDVVVVSPGHARNFLIPRKLAKEATPANIRELERVKAENAARRAEDLDSAKAMAKRLENIHVVIQSKGGEGGKLFGSITSKDLSDALKDQHDIEIDRKRIQLDAPLKQLGEHKVDIKLFAEVSGSLKVIVESV